MTTIISLPRRRDATPFARFRKRLADARKPRRMKEPRAVQLYYMRGLKRIWRPARAIAAVGLRPIFERWPVSTIDSRSSLTRYNDWIDTHPVDHEPTVPHLAYLDDEDDRAEEEVLDELLGWFDDIAAAEGAVNIVHEIAPIEMPRIEVLDHATISRQLDWLELVLGEWFRVADTREVLTTTGQRTMFHNHRELEKVLRIDLRRELPGLQSLINIWREENVALIETGPWAARLTPQLRPGGQLGVVSELVEKAHAEGWRVQEIQRALEKRYLDMPEWRAELIARDQTLKLNGRINQYRQQSVGIQEYTWLTARDSRVRDRHRDLHGTIQRWDNPPDTGKGRHHAGIDFQCRCQAIPRRPDWLR